MLTTTVDAPAQKLKDPPNQQVVSYQKLRTFIGLIGVLLPFVLFFGCLAFGAGDYSLQPSISHYYYSKMHIVFVCALCVLGGFLITYKGKSNANRFESNVSNFAGYCALGVASFPTAFGVYRVQPGRANVYFDLTNDITITMGAFHFICAGLLFSCFVLFCLKFFQQADHPYEGIELEKFERRKRLYKFCGYGIVVSMVLLFFFFIYQQITGVDLWVYSTFAFETTSLVFFGTAWLVKGSEFWSRKDFARPIMKSLR